MPVHEKVHRKNQGYLTKRLKISLGNFYKAKFGIMDNNFRRKKLLDMPLMELVAEANAIRAKTIGNKLDLCNILNAKSGLCREDCKFCAQSARHKTNTPTYPLKPKDEIIKAAAKAKEIGAGRFGIVTSGNRLTVKEFDTIIAAVSEIKDKLGIGLCASLGSLDHAQLKTLKSVGVSRYHHNIETSPNFYAKVVTTHSFKERLDTINSAKQAGLEVCSGGIIGMGEAWPDRLAMADILAELEVDSVPINFLMAIPGTAFADLKPISCNEAIRTIAIFRIMLKDKTIKIAAGRETILKDCQGLGFMAGANGMLIGGYLTIKGRDIESDHQLVREIKELWTT